MGPSASLLRLRIARGLEEGTWDGPVARALSLAYGAIGARSLVRPLAWPRAGGEGDLRIVAVGGATLGGSGKTPLAIACARLLADSGARVAFVAHGYRAHPGKARIVRPDDDIAAVGDEALVAARALTGLLAPAPVVVAPRRQQALDLASELADIIVLDGVLQTAPRRASLSLLALDEASPWGAGQVVPRGDLRASPAALLAACDLAVLVTARSRGAHHRGALLPWSALAQLRLGLFLALARPSRVVALLASRGIVPERIVRVPDHGLPSVVTAAAFPSSAVDLWLATPKCALHLEAAGIPHAVLEHTIELDPPLASALVALAAPRALSCDPLSRPSLERPCGPGAPGATGFVGESRAP